MPLPLRGLLLALLLPALAAADAIREWPAMGTRIRLRVRGGGPDAESAADAMAAAARDAFADVEAATSVFLPGAPPDRLACAAGSGEWIPVPPAFDAALDVALDIAAASGGAFNPLVAPLMERRGHPRRPPDSASPPPSPSTPVPPGLLDCRNIGRRPGACRLLLPGMRLDLGGVAKGTGADLAAAAARTAATNDFLLDAGGTLLGRGNWTIGLRDPRAQAGAPPLRPFTLPGGIACATSGTYERPGHLIDPRTGRPPSAPVLQATALAPSAARADAWSTALCILGPSAAADLLPALPDPPAAAWVLPPPTPDAPPPVLHWPPSPSQLSCAPACATETH